MSNLVASTSTLQASTLVEALQWRAIYQTDQPAFNFLHQGETLQSRLTYGQLARRSQAIGALLQSKKAKETPVLLLIPPGLSYIAAFFGCLYAGAIAVPAYPPTSVRNLPRLRAILADSRARIILTTTETLSMLQQYFAQASETNAVECLAIDAIPDHLADEWLEPDLTSQGLAFLQYTSGSTGEPKGVMVSHSNLLHQCRLIQTQTGMDANSHILSWVPPYHDMGLIGGIIFPVVFGYQSTLMSPVSFLQRPFRWLQAISNYRANVSMAPNFAFDLCCRKAQPEQMKQLDLSTWRIVINGAEPVRVETLKRFQAIFGSCGLRETVLRPAYGLAEGTLMVACASKEKPMVTLTVNKRVLQKGRVHEGTLDESIVHIGYDSLPRDQRIVIAHPETRRSCGPDEVGEIWVAGPSIAQGYWNKPEETQSVFGAYLADTNEGPFMRTGDLGFLHQGVLYVTGRQKDVIIIHGNNHYPQDIELTVDECASAIRAGCSVAFSIEENSQEKLVVLVEIDPRYASSAQAIDGKESINRKLLDGENLIATIQHAISVQHDLRVHQVILLKAGSVLKTSSGKLQRQACRAAFLDGNLSLWGE